MLRNLSALEGFPIRALDGEIGRAIDTYFEDYTWTVRYLVVDTGKWLPGRKVLVSPFAVRGIGWTPRHLDVGLTREHVKGSPDIDTDKPVSRQHETAYFDYYGYPYYWQERFAGVRRLFHTSSQPTIALTAGVAHARRRIQIRICGAPKQSLVMTSRPSTDRSVTLKISSSTRRTGPCDF